MLSSACLNPSWERLYFFYEVWNSGIAAIGQHAEFGARSIKSLLSVAVTRQIVARSSKRSLFCGSPFSLNCRFQSFCRTTCIWSSYLTWNTFCFMRISPLESRQTFFGGRERSGALKFVAFRGSKGATKSCCLPKESNCC